MRIHLCATVLALTGCQFQQPTQDETSEATAAPDDDWLERMRHTPLKSEIAINDEYGISAVFPKGSPVCTADSGGHIHGFLQWLDGDCTSEAPGVRSDRYLSVWADYNAAEYSLDQAVESVCPDGTKRGALEVVVPEARGWAASCREEDGDEKQQLIIVFLRKDDEAREGFGPDGIAAMYTVRLRTDAAHRATDFKTLETFLRQLKLAGTRLTLAA